MTPSTIAIVGMAGCFPGAPNIRQFWRNLREGVESIRSLTDDELLAAGATAEDINRSDYVKRASMLDDVPMFDAAFFGLSPRDAAIMDPQHRHFLECAWEALEDAAHPPQRFSGSIGVFAGSGMNSYLIHNLLANRELLKSAGLFQMKQTGNDKDVLATRLSYQLDLRGPSINVQTACSTSLVAVHLACQSLLDFECDMALAGGVTIEIPNGHGYIFREGELLSGDGRCRAFDAAANGTVFGSGAGIVVLRRLEDALADRDNIRAVILGSAVNNDGARKVGYFAPSVEGQAEVIAEALEFAGVTADDISYVEAHGTGTTIGDPIEIRALTQAFRKSTSRNGYCRIGSVKTNLGHLDAAAGIAGLIKTVLALEHAQLPASLHFQTPNPHIEFQDSPFFVNSKLSDWPSQGSLRRACVTSLGIGGTNAHVVLEEAPRQTALPEMKPYRLFTISAKSESALERATQNLIAHLDAHPEVSLADASFTCQLGRHSFLHRRAWVVDANCDTIGEPAEGKHKRSISGVAATHPAQVAFMFSGQGSQHVNMGRELYEHEAGFRESMDLCAEYLLEPLGFDVREALYPPQAEQLAAQDKLNQTWLTQPALFAVEYSLARWWMSLGIKPIAMAGHSIGEYVAACLAGVFTLEEALAIAAFRGRLMHDLPTGAMLAVSMPASELHLTGNLCLAAINGPGQCVVSGPAAEIAALELTLGLASVFCRRLITSHAFHSAMMDPILATFERRLGGITYHPPDIPYLSNVTGTWIRAEEATDPAYWSRHLRNTVRFSDSLEELFRNPGQIILEVGPGNTLTSLARRQGGAGVKAYQSLPHPRESDGALRFALQTLGQLWTLGANVDFAKLHSPESVRRVPLPTYPFEHLNFWIQPDNAHAGAAPITINTAPERDGDNIAFYRRVWKSTPLTNKRFPDSGRWMVFRDSLGLGDQLRSTLAATTQEVIFVDAGSSYGKSADGSYAVRPGVRADYDALVADVLKSNRTPTKILHLWPIMPEGEGASLKDVHNRCFLSPLLLAQALGSQDISDWDIGLVSNHMLQVFSEPVRNPARAVLLGPGRVIPKELPGITCRSIDMDFVSERSAECAALLIAEMNAGGGNFTVAFRDGGRFVESVEPLTLPVTSGNCRLERGGVYVITGGLGGLGLAVAEHLAREFKACLVLITRSTLPSESKWEACLLDGDMNVDEKCRIQKLIEIRSVAAGLTIARGDVTNLAQMRDAVALAIKQYGRIDGVFHAAGVLDDGPLMLKTEQSAARVLDPKVRGTLVLEAALRNVPLRCFVLFSSISSIDPPPGQVDYAAANAFLDAFAASRKGPVTVVNWGAWRDVGMASRAGSAHPLLRARVRDTSHETVYASQFSQQNLWLLSEHKLKAGQALKALFPGTGYMEMAAAAFARGSRPQAIEFQDVFFLAPLMLEGDETRPVRVQLRDEQEAGSQKGVFRFSVFSRTSEWIEHCTGTIGPCLSQPAEKADRSTIVARCSGREVVFDAQHRPRQERHLAFGPRWQSLRRLLIGKDEALAEIELDEKLIGDVSIFRKHPALLDLATGASVYLTADYENSEDLFLPVSYKRMRVYRSLPAKLFSHIRTRQHETHRSEVEIFDITLFDEQGQVLAEIEGFSMRRITDPVKALAEGAWAGDNLHTHGQGPIEIPDHAGILPSDGVRALVRILSTKSPRAVIAVSRPLGELDHASRVTLAQDVGEAAPELARSNETIEGTLAAWWREMLGVNEVGLDEDFFSLGGHSLIGIRLLAKVRREYEVNLDFGVLFEARTVRELADAIRKLQSVTAGEQVRDT